MRGILRPLSLVTALAAGVACGEAPIAGPATTTSDPRGEPAAPEAILVSVSTSGAYRASDSYQVRIDSRLRGSIAPNGQLMIQGLTSLPHFVELTGLREECLVTDTHPKRVVTTGGVVGAATFSVFCASGPGRIRVSTSTRSIVGVFSSGYTLVLDGQVHQHIPSIGTAFFFDVSAGVHTVELIDLEPGCGFFQPRSYFSRTVDVREDAEALVSFDVLCVG